MSKVEASVGLVAYWSDNNQFEIQEMSKASFSSKSNLMEPVISPSVQLGVLDDVDHRLSKEFLVTSELRSSVNFWLRIYTEFTRKQFLLLDGRHPEITYEVLDFRDLFGELKDEAVYQKTAKDIIHDVIRKYREACRSLQLNPKPKKANYEESHILAAVRNLEAKLGHKHSFSDLGDNIKVQMGQSDFLARGIMNAQPFLSRMEQIFSQMGVPVELTRLSLVESSFNYGAVSKVGAIGLWQFMESTGKSYLTIDDSLGIDERLSPLKSTVAAAKLLKANFGILKNWPLAITAYNHGIRGLKQFSVSRQIASAFNSCRKRQRVKLGWASRNYYAEFLAVLRVEAYRKELFGVVPEIAPRFVSYRQISVPQSAVSVALSLGVSLSDLLSMNPDIENMNQTLPGGFALALPSVKDDFSILTGSGSAVDGLDNNSEAEKSLNKAQLHLSHPGKPS